MATAATAKPAGATAQIDFSMFDDLDVANLILQRSEVGNVGQQIRDWIDGNDAPLMAYAGEHRDRVLAETYRVAERECGFFVEATDPIAPKRIADIGCGYGFADLVLYRRYQSEVVLIDIEEGDARHFGFQAEGAGYANLKKARSFLEKNSVPKKKIVTLNPKHQDVGALGQFDLAISLASCGFHYPVATYDGLFSTQISPGGAIVLDIRKGSGGIGAMKAYGPVEVLAKHTKYATAIARRS